MEGKNQKESDGGGGAAAVAEGVIQTINIDQHQDPSPFFYPLPYPPSNEARNILYSYVASWLMNIILMILCIFSLIYFRILELSDIAKQQMLEEEEDTKRQEDELQPTLDKYKFIAVPGEVTTILVLISCIIAIIYESLLANPAKSEYRIKSKPMCIWLHLALFLLVISCLQLCILLVALVNPLDGPGDLTHNKLMMDHSISTKFLADEKFLPKPSPFRVGQEAWDYKEYFTGAGVNTGLGLLFVMCRCYINYIMLSILNGRRKRRRSVNSANSGAEATLAEVPE